jgi:outer membrane autotransporter protein
MRFRLQFVLLLIGLFAGMAEAQNPTIPLGVAGTIQDTSGAVIVGAQVIVTTQDGRTIAQGTTDSSGSFRFANVSAGNYTVDVTRPSFREVKQQIKVGSGTRPQLRIIMPVASVNQDVTVAAPDSPAQVSTEI